MINLSQLNSMYSAFLDTKFSALDSQIVKDNITLANFEDGAFALNSPIAGKISVIKPEIETDKDMGIVRYCIGYGVANKALSDFNTGIHNLAVAKLQMLATAANHFDLEKCEVVTFRLPGSPANYFRELESAEGIELRLFVSKTKPPEGN